MPFFFLSVALLAVAPATDRCPARDFATFATRFADDVAIQRKYTATPLIDDHIDANADPEPATITRRLDAGTLRFPLMPNRAARAKDGLVLSTRALAGGDHEATLAHPDSGYQIRYRFQRVRDCWQLVRRSDDSI